MQQKSKVFLFVLFHNNLLIVPFKHTAKCDYKKSRLCDNVMRFGFTCVTTKTYIYKHDRPVPRLVHVYCSLMRPVSIVLLNMGETKFLFLQALM